MKAAPFLFIKRFFLQEQALDTAVCEGRAWACWRLIGDLRANRDIPKRGHSPQYQYTYMHITTYLVSCLDVCLTRPTLVNLPVYGGPATLNEASIAGDKVKNQGTMFLMISGRMTEIVVE
jgi:hypothetical protein